MSKDKYDRQTRLWGEGQILISASKLLCLNSDSLSSEILKNLILSGTGEVTLVDSVKISPDDLKSNFFIEADDIGKLRSEIVLKNLLELNPDVKQVTVIVGLHSETFDVELQLAVKENDIMDF